MVNAEPRPWYLKVHLDPAGDDTDGQPSAFGECDYCGFCTDVITAANLHIAAGDAIEDLERHDCDEDVGLIVEIQTVEVETSAL